MNEKEEVLLTPSRTADTSGFFVRVYVLEELRKKWAIEKPHY